MGERKLCMGCMENKGTARVCPHCGYVENTPYSPSYIAPGIVLHDRYLIGKLISSNGEGATYIAYDNAVSCKVLVREYLPEGLCSRVKGKPTISVNYNNLAQYKALMAEYTELNKSLARMRSLNHLTPTLDLFAENNTTYAVYEYIDGVTLIDYLKEHAGDLSWEQVSVMFPPLFTTLSLIHNAGVVHRGICPENIYVTNKGDLKLTAFCISAVRTANTELNCEIYNGYAAPEQYSASSRQGTWTDVYGICAVLYRILTGCMPPSAQSRLESDTLYEPIDLNHSIPKHVSDVIIDGMALDGDDRIQTITELVTRLFEHNESGFAQGRVANVVRTPYTAGKVQETQDDDYDEYDDGYDDEYYDDGYDDGYGDDYDEAPLEQESTSAFDRIKIPIIIGVLVAAIILVLAIILLNIFNSDGGEKIRDYSSHESVVEETDETEEETEETTEEETKEQGEMPDLIGKSFEEMKEKYKDEFNLEAIEDYSDDYKKGQIFWQAVKKGKKYSKGDTITVKVSKGVETVQLPDYDDYFIGDYLKKLDSLGISYKKEAKESDEYEKDVVMGASVEVGASIKPGETITVYYAKEPKPTEAPTEKPTEKPTEAKTEAATEAPTQAPVVETEAAPQGEAAGQ